jgi:AraC family transcriptional regulator, regulatory protein of adaptative response / DNA-3-methyladenine glycosylase II
MRMSHAQMYGRLLAGDATWNGRFFTGVLTTGIYCLPSCKARKPKSENVRFFPNCEAAREAGLRACKKCHPDDYARGADPVLETIETVVDQIRRSPADFKDAKAVVRRTGFGTTRAFELFRQHYHSTPADLLLRARLQQVKQALIQTKSSVTDVAFATGFEGLSAFHDNFQRLNGLTPNDYRSLPIKTHFKVTLPAEYPLGYLRRALGRDAQSVSEKLVGDTYTTAVQFLQGPAVIELKLAPSAIAVTAPAGCGLEAHQLVIGLLGLDQEAGAFSRLAWKLGLARLVAGRPELRISQTHSIYDGLLWSIIGQQINLPFACLLKRRLFELTGTPIGDGLFAPPLPSAVAALKSPDLLPLQFSRQKADYVVSISRLVADGKLDLAAIRTMSATRIERTLLAVRGLGPWSVNYLMMRALGLADCVPYGDTGVTSGLQSLLKLDLRPDIDTTRRLMAVFSPYRSLATAHLWQFNHPLPA